MRFMSWRIELRFMLSKCVLLLAHLLAALLQKFAHAKRPHSPMMAGRDQPDVSALALAPASEVFALEPGFPHHTLKSLPASEEYVWPMNLTKALVKLGLEISLATPERWTEREAVRDLFSPIPPPRAASLRLSDDIFVRLRLQGPNPAWIRRCDNIEQLHGDGLCRSVNTAQWNDGPLYVVNYHKLLADLPSKPGQYVSPCIAIFTLNNHGSLDPVGIQLTRSDRTTWWQEPSATPAWELAKLFFQSADMLVHEAVSHFLWTHIYGEKIALATLRHLPESHPIRRLISPHLHGTLRANYNSGRRLIGRGGLFDTCFAAGWEGTAVLLQRGVELWRYDQMLLPKQIAERQVDDISDYPYRDDGLELWQIVERYVSNYTHLFFDTEKSLLSDQALHHWSRELRSHGFEEATTLSSLNRLLTAALFNVVQHTFVNALQFDMFACPLLFPSTMHVPVPREASEVTEQTLLAAMPTVAQTLEATRATFAFSIQYNVLGDDLVAFHQGPGRVAAETFVRELAAFAEHAERRDDARQIPYLASHPRRISNSINA